ncbi:hypothetical protein BDN70DRAFT_887589 [Pholiota conissans]|uniref:Uncharacterized protein n=1 Tax=Pholiota conissans TaxID=109636 RepID=A0A9P5YMJ4_9AGAR|nr:hypothetical protein BDN70DRAFT_887589 [Pholiota conissans]
MTPLSAIEYLSLDDSRAIRGDEEKKLKGGRKHPSTSSSLFACSSPHLRLSSSALLAYSHVHSSPPSPILDLQIRSPHPSLEGRGKGVVTQKRPSTSLVGGEGGTEGGRKEAGHIPQWRGAAPGEEERAREGWW